MSQSTEDSTIYTEKPSSPTELIPARYFGESSLEASRIVQVIPFKRTVLLTPHRARAADFSQHQWLFKQATSEIWYEKPAKSIHQLQPMALNESSGPRNNPNPIALETPRVWSSDALTTPPDDDIYDCTAGHSRDGDFMGTCHDCTDEKSEALERTELVYCLVVSTSHSTDQLYGPGMGTQNHGRQIYKLVKCGSREAAVVEAFYAAGCNGWNVLFSCVLRMGETFDERDGRVERVDALWKLAEKKSGDTIRVFY
ncbi:hypothetical protein K505DRAFT_317263 [Melanomma pulvis-pyrius CBS 109.77]|uniref:Uncharacterized protein n=1 Tax=Melanomma pulvis-pyrius CBS 109.77 TaxID=1314802 RepID=A0A6A6WT68_9PLEO|nr:hypothetical protein K505DRAFT_317263 [Melanomma pulvis-pyrius CBS 109.77]